MHGFNLGGKHGEAAPVVLLVVTFFFPLSVRHGIFIERLFSFSFFPLASLLYI